ncbi:hypothetical protein [Tepidibacter mesophilus]|uniref:hypothetical protein n=1 Tax=Tepidibacter mesophilus TaxID=655607 RepID=UPI0011AF220E|nr:hypothetical protein [Tepidibacter mesophilus]
MTNKLVKEDYFHGVINISKKRKWNFEEIKGNTDMIENLINGYWNKDDFEYIYKVKRKTLEILNNNI